MYSDKSNKGFPAAALVLIAAVIIAFAVYFASTFASRDLPEESAAAIRAASWP